MTTIYVVTTGEYSDYMIHSVWSTKGKALAFIKAANKYMYVVNDEVGEYDLDTTSEPHICIQVQMEKNGSSSADYTETSSRGFQFFNDWREESFYWVVDTVNETRAIKVVNEKRAQILAANLWGDEKAVKALFKQGL